MSNPMTDVAEIARIKARISELEQEITYNPPSECGWGPECPYCIAAVDEIERLRAHLTQEQPR